MWISVIVASVKLKLPCDMKQQLQTIFILLLTLTVSSFSDNVCSALAPPMSFQDEEMGNGGIWKHNKSKSSTSSDEQSSSRERFELLMLSLSSRDRESTSSSRDTIDSRRQGSREA